jgi:hypothetical protein
MSAIKFQSGDQVKVREDLIVGQEYGGQIFTEYMAALKGFTLFIDIVAPEYYWILADDYTWTDEMLQPAK